MFPMVYTLLVFVLHALFIVNKAILLTFYVPKSNPKTKTVFKVYS